MDDWQDAAFSTRHMHSRVSGSGNRSTRSNAFDVRRTFGTYSIQCPAQQKIMATANGALSDQHASLQLYRLTENGEGIIGELSLPGVLHAAVILAGSRESLRRTVLEMESESDKDETEKENDEIDPHGLEPSETATESDPARDPFESRFETFEKNSFRSPKFWFQWRGRPTTSMSAQGSANPGPSMSEMGYLVFTGNNCRKVKGTINCSFVNWTNTAITGHKVTSRSESNTLVYWD